MKRMFLCALTIVVACLRPAAQTSGGEIVRLDPALDEIVDVGTPFELLKEDYFGFTEGPVWVQDGTDGYLLFSDVAANAIYKWTPEGVSVFLANAGYTGTDVANVGGQSFNGRLHLIVFGPCGITLDRQGRVVFTTFGDRNITRLEKDGTRTVLAGSYQGKRLNSPNDLAMKSNGSLYFTDFPGGLRGGAKSPAYEGSPSGVFLLKDGTLQLLDTGAAFTMGNPNGIAISPDEKFLYVNGARRIFRYEIRPDDTIANGQLFVDMTAQTAPGGTDGMKVDQKGNLYSTGAGGVWVISPAGKHLGTIRPPVGAANLAFGDADSRSLYFAARGSLYRIRVKTPGVRP